MKYTLKGLVDRITHFNNEAEARGLRSRLKYDNGENNTYKLLLGSADQFCFGTWQAVICEGTVRECTLALIALYITLSFELNMY